jgi:hypothetical protein
MEAKGFPDWNDDGNLKAENQAPEKIQASSSKALTEGNGDNEGPGRRGDRGKS